MAPKSPITDEQEARVLAMYKARDKTADITAATGLTRSSIYWVLEKNGIEPNRIRRRPPIGAARAGDDLGGQVVRLRHLLSEAQDEVGLMRAKVHVMDQLMAAEASGKASAETTLSSLRVIVSGILEGDEQ